MTFVTSRAKAITFVELLIVIIVIGILMGISLPNLKKTFNNLQLNSFSRQLQTFMNYLRERAIVEGKIICLNIDNEKKEYWTKIKDARTILKTYPLPEDIGIEADQKQILFYPDGHIDNVTIKLINLNNQSITLTTKGVYGRVKLQTQK